MPQRRVRNVALLVTVALVPLAGPGNTARADAGPGPLPSASSPAPTPVNASSPGLRLPPGDTLAPPKVLDITSVVSDSHQDETESQSNTTITYALQADVLFGKDSYQLDPAALDRINAVAADINQAKVTSTIRVFGFTDDLGTFAHGTWLATKRAQAIYQVLARQVTGGNSFDVRGYGNQYYIADNSTEAGRRLNRRVEISFTPAV